MLVNFYYNAPKNNKEKYREAILWVKMLRVASCCGKKKNVFRCLLRENCLIYEVSANIIVVELLVELTLELKISNLFIILLALIKATNLKILNFFHF